MRFIVTCLCFFSFASSAYALSTEAQIQAKKAFQYLDKRQWDRALSAGERSGDPYIKAAITWYYLTRNPNMGDFEDYLSFLARYPSFPSKEKLETRAELKMLELNNEYALKRWFNDHPAHTSRGIYEKEALKRKPSVETIINAWIKGDFSPASKTQFLSRHQDVLNTNHHEARLDRLLWEKNTKSAKRMKKHVSNDYWKLAEARMALMNGSKGVDGKISAVPAKLRQNPGLIFERMRFRHKRKNYAGTRDLLLQAPAQVPYPEKWWYYRKWHIREMLEERNYKLASQLTARHGQTATVERSEALWLKGWTDLAFMNRPKPALTDFKTIYEIVKFPISKSRGAYWAGRAAAASGNNREASRWFERAAQYPTTFYGQLAYQSLYGKRALNLPRYQITQKGEHHSRLPNHALTQVIKTLGDAHLIDRALPFLRHAVKTAKNEREAKAIMRIGRDYHRPDLTLRAAKDAHYHRGWLDMESTYPIYQLAQHNPAEPAYVHAIMRQESMFNPRAVSSAGARGLMQVMPNTAKITARKHNLSYSKQRLFEPEYNIQIGSHFLGSLVDQFRGSYALAAAGYNAGPGRPKSWQERFGVPGRNLLQTINWLEMIPFSETRNYVQRVLENYQVYRQVLSGDNNGLNAENVLLR